MSERDNDTERALARVREREGEKRDLRRLRSGGRQGPVEFVASAILAPVMRPVHGMLTVSGMAGGARSRQTNVKSGRASTGASYARSPVMESSRDWSSSRRPPTCSRPSVPRAPATPSAFMCAR